jgi:hypothetical protein
MTQNTLNRNGKMLLANWFEIPEKEYIWYKLQGYDIYADSDQVMWYLDDKPHREDGPARIWANGDQEWRLNDKLHREDGPAVIYADGYRAWHLNGKRHRTDGPARIWADGPRAWYLNGKQYTESEWKDAVSQLV